MEIKITQYRGPDHTFETFAEYEAFLKSTKEELVDLREYIDGVEILGDSYYAELYAMWCRVYDHEHAEEMQEQHEILNERELAMDRDNRNAEDAS